MLSSSDDGDEARCAQLLRGKEQEEHHVLIQCLREGGDLRGRESPEGVSPAVLAPPPRYLDWLAAQSSEQGLHSWLSVKRNLTELVYPEATIRGFS